MGDGATGSLQLEQLTAFLTDGWIEVQPESLTEIEHESLYRSAHRLYELAEAAESPTAHLEMLGDNLRARLPLLDRLFDDPAIDGALRSLVGPDYLVHPHSYCHRSSHRDQVFHQDGNLPWNERGHVRSHRPDWLMLFYYPQPVDEANGPTEVVVGSQYWTVDHETPDGGWRTDDRVSPTVDDAVFSGPDLAARDRAQAAALAEGLPVVEPERRFLHVAAGTVVIAHYDLFHRGSRTTAGAPPRYLYKFYAARVHEPAAPAPGIVPSTLSSTPDRVAPVVGTVARSLDPARRVTSLNDAPSTDARSEVAALEHRLLSGREDERVLAAYLLAAAAGNGSAPALAALASGLEAEREASRRAAGHGLRNAGPAAGPVLVAALGADLASTRRAAVAALGSLAPIEPEVVDRLCDVVGADPDDLVRSNAAYSLGQIARSLPPTGPMEPAQLVARIADALLDRLGPGVEPDNAHNAGFSRSTVRQSAAFALLLVLANHRLDSGQLVAIVRGPLHDGDRYVQGLVVEGLVRAHDLPAAITRDVYAYLAARRWSPAPR